MRKGITQKMFASKCHVLFSYSVSTEKVKRQPCWTKLHRWEENLDMFAKLKILQTAEIVPNGSLLTKQFLYSTQWPFATRQLACIQVPLSSPICPKRTSLFPFPSTQTQVNNRKLPSTITPCTRRRFCWRESKKNVFYAFLWSSTIGKKLFAF